MTKFKVLFVFALVGLLAGCAKDIGKVEPAADGSQYSALLHDADGNPIPCATDQQCEGLVDRDGCVYGAVCQKRFCAALLFDTCCVNDGKEIKCPSFQSCGGATDCEDSNECTKDACNTFLFGGVCTHAPTYLGEKVCGQGACQKAVPLCKDGQPNAEECVPGAPSPELCNGLDDDCDGTADEDFPEKGAECLVGQGVCQQTGKLVCKPDGSGTQCDALPGEPGPELCDSLDNDCDGTADEDFPDLGKSCSVGVGECLRNGTFICKPDGSATECSVVPGAPSLELCNGLDDDCDGTADEELGETTCGLGVCLHTVQNCVNGVPQQCDPLQGAFPEVCDLLDNDCDGATDEEDVCSTCKDNFGQVVCGGGLYPGATDGADWLHNYSCADWDESGSEGVFYFVSGLAGVEVTVKPININPAGADLDIFILQDSCAAGSCMAYGDKVATFNPVVASNYYIVVDGYAGASGSFDLAVSCKEKACNDQLDNDSDGKTDCADPDCFGPACAGTQELCTGGVDEDQDGLTDCNDPDCKFADVCLVACQAMDPIACAGTKADATIGGVSLLGGYSCTALDETGPEKVYSFTPAFTGTGWAALSGLSAQLDVFVLHDECKANTCLAWGDNIASFGFAAGHTYYIVVDGFAGAAGSYTLSLTCALPPM